MLAERSAERFAPWRRAITASQGLVRPASQAADGRSNRDGLAAELAEVVAAGQPYFSLMIIVTNQNGVGADQHNYPVGVACLCCSHRGAIPLDIIQAKGCVRRLLDRRWKCAHCGSREVELALFFSSAQVDAWVAGKSYAEVWDLRFDGKDLTQPPYSLYVGDPNPFRAAHADVDR